MKKTAILFFCAILSGICFAQQNKEVTFLDIEWGSSSKKVSEYMILKEYKIYSEVKSLINEGSHITFNGSFAGIGVDVFTNFHDDKFYKAGILIRSKELPSEYWLPDVIEDLSNMLIKKYGKPKTIFNNSEIGSITKQEVWSFANGAEIELNHWKDNVLSDGVIGGVVILTYTYLPLQDIVRKHEKERMDAIKKNRMDDL